MPERISKEFVIATARLLLASGALLAIYIDPLEPSRFAGIGYSLLCFYVLFAAVAIFLIGRPDYLRLVPFFFTVDAAWPALISVFTDGPNTPFYLFFLFVLLTCSYRWGIRPTVNTASIYVVLFLAEAGVLEIPSVKRYLDSDYDVSRLVMRSIYLLIMGLLIGYLGEEERALRDKLNASLGLVAKVGEESKILGCIASVLGYLADIFSAKSAACFCQRKNSSKSFMFVVDSELKSLRSLELTPEESAEHKKILDKELWIARAGKLTMVGLPVPIPWLRLQWRERKDFPKQIGGYSYKSILSYSFDFGESWTCRIFVIEPSRRARARKLDLLKSVIRQSVPAIYNVYLLEQLRERAGQIERARLARALHDSTLQSLSGIRMQLEAMRLSARLPAKQTTEIFRIEELLRDQAIELRALMLGRELIKLDSSTFPQRVREMVAKLGREGRIRVNFICTGKPLRLSTTTCKELLLTIHEALSNVIKHSGAKNAAVVLNIDDWVCRVSIADDGNGFQFSGRYSLTQLDSGHMGPTVLRERAHGIGADMIIDSIPGRGATIEFVVKQAMLTNV
jgi:signal transduction histidine kinase